LKPLEAVLWKLPKVQGIRFRVQVPIFGDRLRIRSDLFSNPAKSLRLLTHSMVKDRKVCPTRAITNPLDSTLHNSSSKMDVTLTSHNSLLAGTAKARRRAIPRVILLHKVSMALGGHNTQAFHLKCFHQDKDHNLERSSRGVDHNRDPELSSRGEDRLDHNRDLERSSRGEDRLDHSRDLERSSRDKGRLDHNRDLELSSKGKGRLALHPTTICIHKVTGHPSLGAIPLTEAVDLVLNINNRRDKHSGVPQVITPTGSNNKGLATRHQCGQECRSHHRTRHRKRMVLGTTLV